MQLYSNGVNPPTHANLIYKTSIKNGNTRKKNTEHKNKTQKPSTRFYTRRQSKLTLLWKVADDPFSKI